MPDAPLTVVVVHRDTSERLADSLDALDRSTLPAVALVVDNGSVPAHLDRARTTVAEHGGTLIEMGANTGFGPGANAGWRRWLDEGVGEWVALMPHDALPAVDALERLVAEGSARPRAGLVSADVGDGATPVIDPYFGGITRPRAVDDGWEAADHPHGTLMLARRACLDDIGLFDERYFAYCEEADLGIRAREAGWEVGIVHGARVVNPAVGPATAAVDYLQMRNTLILVREHSGRYHATIRYLMAIGQIAAGSVRPDRQLPWFSARARLRALVDFPLGRVGPPPASLLPRPSPPDVTPRG
ncbi:MAG TPA: hypothetical protein VK866_05645 [Acidimicrobiales bacterium]|nr:hypothetical protein [Acidimicrobiales bacterium]